uniref:DUF262 domain-containing protein n=1 Tax=Lactococcus garvieae TaxID=1363 RepID=UPI00359C9232
MTTIAMENLSTLFRDKLYRIPDYQRGYAWTEKQLEEFWNDIELLEDGNKEHYLGVLTTQDVPSEEYSKLENDMWLIKNKHYSPVYIVDGQQRITTCLLLLCAIVEISEIKHSAEEINYTNIEDIKKRYFYEKKGTHELYSMIFGYLSDDPLHTFLAKHIYKIPNFVFNSTEIHTKYTSNLENAFDYFTSKLEALSFNDIENIFSKLITRLVFNTYNVSERLDVFVTFETMNNRGKELSVLELLKNRLIYLTTLKPDNDSNADKDIREKINQTWKKLYDYLGKNSQNLLDDDTFLSAFLSVYQFPDEILSDRVKITRYQIMRGLNFQLIDRNINSYILDEIFTVKNIRNEIVTLDDIYQFISELSKNVVIWYELENQIDANYSNQLLQLVLEYNQLTSLKNRWDRPTEKIKIFEYFIKNPEEDKRVKFLETMNYINLVYILFIKPNEFSLKSDFAFKLQNMISQIEDNETSDFLKIKRDINALLKDRQNLETIVELLRINVKNDYNGKKRVNYYESSFPITYILSKYEISKLHENREVVTKEFLHDYLFDNKKYNIEHILPQSKSRNKNWDSILDNLDPNQKHNLKFTLGNLIRISTNKNNALGNKSFEYKLGKFSSGTYSERLIVSTYDTWDKETIKKRGRELLTFLLNLLGVPKLNNTQKDYILGLDDF